MLHDTNNPYWKRLRDAEIIGPYPLADMLAFWESKPADEKYPWAIDYQRCPVMQYRRHVESIFSLTYWDCNVSPGMSRGLKSLIIAEPRTFGALCERVRAEMGAKR